MFVEPQRSKTSKPVSPEIHLGVEVSLDNSSTIRLHDSIPRIIKYVITLFLLMRNLWSFHQAPYADN